MRGFVLGDRILQSTDSHADYCAAYGALGEYQFVGASAVGKMHLHRGSPRDDAFAVRTAGPWLALAVSDGVGSRQLSRYGATFAAEALCEQMLREAITISTQETTELPAQTNSPEAVADSDVLFPDIASGASEWFPSSVLEAANSRPAPLLGLPENGTVNWYRPTAADPSSPGSGLTASGLELGASTADLLSKSMQERMRHAFQRTHLGIEQFAQGRGLAMGDLSCTLLGVLLHTETGEIVAGHIGDGLIAARYEDGETRPFTDPPSPGETGAIYSFTGRDWESRLTVTSSTGLDTQSVETIFLMTDGVSEDCTNAPPTNILQRWATDVDREVRRELPPCVTAARLAKWLASYDAPSSFDDRTLIVVTRTEPKATQQKLS